jgi:hypothetical protein
MNIWIKSSAASLALAVAGFMLTQPASAGCTSNGGYGVKPAVYLSDASAGNLLLVSDDEAAIITGLWKVTFTAKGNGSAGPPDNTVVDAGYATWHADGTELMNSGREPITGNFCMGVWKQVGARTFKLNHVALAWDNTGTVLIGPASIRETVTVDATGNHYSGTFSITQYASDGHTPLGGVIGTVSATRVTVN